MSIWTELMFMGGYIATPRALADAAQATAAGQGEPAPVAPIAATEVAAVGVAVSRPCDVGC